MKIKAYFSIAVFSLFAVLAISQITKVNAQNSASPITGPVTSFTSTIRGHITYRFLKQFPKINSVYVIPARNVAIKAEISKDPFGPTIGQISTKTDMNGNYALEVKDGIIILDTIIASDVKQTGFLPNAIKTGVLNFHGDIRYRLSLSGFNAAKGSKAGDRKYSVEYDADNNGRINNVDFRLLKPILSK